MADWVVATDIGKRLAELRAVLGEGQSTFAERFGRVWKRVSAWENGKARPPRSALEQAAAKYGWDTAMFAEGGPYPKQALESLKRPAVARKQRHPGRRREDEELRQKAALASQNAVANAAALLDGLLRRIAFYRDAGKDASVDVLEEWLVVYRANPPDPSGGAPPTGPPPPPTDGPGQP